MRVTQLMSRKVQTVRESETAHAAVHLMWIEDVGSIPVVDDHGRLRGVITDRDACMAAAMDGRPLHEISVARAMATTPITTREQAEVKDAVRLMARHQILRLPVVDAEARVVGILSLFDVAQETEMNPILAVHVLDALCAIKRARRPRAQATPKSQVTRPDARRATPRPRG